MAELEVFKLWPISELEMCIDKLQVFQLSIVAKFVWLEMCIDKTSNVPIVAN
jgi:hypothetical protein